MEPMSNIVKGDILACGAAARNMSLQLDELVALPATPEKAADAMRRSARWSGGRSAR